jgi:hypothetical protein
VHHCTIQINHQPDATIFQFIILMFIYGSTYFGHFPAHHQELNDCSGNLWFYLRIVVTVMLCSWSGWPWTQHNCYHNKKVKPEAATAVIELLMMGGKMPETCWAINKQWGFKLENCCIWLVIYLELCKAASCWIYIGIYLRCTDPWTSNLSMFNYSMQRIGLKPLSGYIWPLCTNYDSGLRRQSAS